MVHQWSPSARTAPSHNLGWGDTLPPCLHCMNFMHRHPLVSYKLYWGSDCFWPPSLALRELSEMEPGITLSGIVATNHMWLFTFKWNEKFDCSVTLPTFPVPNRHRSLVATVKLSYRTLSSSKNFCWTTLTKGKKTHSLVISYSQEAEATWDFVDLRLKRKPKWRGKLESVRAPYDNYSNWYKRAQVVSVILPMLSVI